MPEMFSPSAAEWKDVQSWLADALARIKQVESFNAEMDSRQAKAEDTLMLHGSTLTAHNGRTASLESWRKSADATMVFTEKEILAVKAEVPKLVAADTALGNRLGSIEAWKPQIDGKVATIQGQITSLQSSVSQASARIDGLVTSLNKLSSDLNSLTQTVSAMNTQVLKIATLEARIAVCEEKLKPIPKEGGEDVSGT